MRHSHSPEPHHTLTLAKQDEVSLVAALLNQILQPKGITARVGRNHNCLGILLEAIPIPDPEEMVALIRQSLATLNLESIRLVKVCGYEPEQILPAWYEEIELEGLFASTPYPAASLTSWINQGIPESEYEINRVGYDGLPLQGWEPHSETAIDGATPRFFSNAIGGFDDRFLRFSFNAKETALLPLSSIQQVLKVPVAEILPIPEMPSCVLGVYNWRGEMIWLVDLPQQLGFESTLINSDPSENPTAAMKTITETDIETEMETITAIVIHTDRQMLGMVVPQLGNIETYALSQLQPPLPAFPAKFLSFMKGYFLVPESPVLDTKALIQDPLLRVHYPR